MKKLTYLFGLLGLMGLIFISSCSDDDDGGSTAAPSVTAPAITSVQVGQSVDLSFSVTTPGGYKSSSVSQSSGSATVSTEPAAGATSGTVVVSYTAGTSAGAATVTLTVTDNADQTGSQNGTVNVSDSPVPTISGIPATASIVGGNTLEVTAELAAEDGIATFTVVIDGTTTAIDSTFTGSPTSANVPVAYPTSLVTATTTAEIVFTVTDGDGDDVSFTHTLTIEPPSEVELASSRLGLAEYPGFDAATNTLTMIKGITYILDGFVFVNYGQTLVIQEGVVIKGLPGQGSGASALIVARGGTIEANGTADEPIIMTGVADNLQGSVLNESNALWGGLIILGTATNNECNGGVCGTNIEGLPADTEPRGIFGYGDTEILGPNGELVDENGADYATIPTGGQEVTFTEDAADDSGVLNYVSVRHGGSIIGDNNEINGITFGAVGTGTEVEFIEVWSNLDDGIEFFGGTVNLKYVVLGYIGDDFIDYDLGYDGHIQYALAYQKASTSVSSDPNFGEHDGGSSPDDATPFGSPIFSHITYYGADADGLQALVFYRDNAGGEIWNSIFHNADGQILIEDRSGEDSYERFLAGQPGGDNDNRIFISNNLFSDISVGGVDLANINDVFGAVDGNDLNDVPASTTAIQGAFGPINAIGAPDFGTTGTSIFVPSQAGDAATGGADASAVDPFFDNVTFRGAFDPAATTNWIDGWTKTAEVIQ
ncbi:hypothetical protein QQ020_20950 [Fulvivirgaceae bacterium BMA12]|uniref:Uncharacterized protein n=1 Tax=Agaribacillus aureus TaxID=3051825 RepID=A0ABT8LBJ2_9BACT|nr:hypothetical protein [Fulvivirgaceae bacterium BMA12]